MAFKTTFENKEIKMKFQDNQMDNTREYIEQYKNIEIYVLFLKLSDNSI